MLSWFMNKDRRKINDYVVKVDRKEDHLSGCDQVIEVNDLHLTTLKHAIKDNKACFDKADIELILNHYNEESSTLLNQVGVLIFKKNINKLCLVNKNDKNFRRIYMNNNYVQYHDDADTFQFKNIVTIDDSSK
jgi:hypothetical protein